MAVRRKGQGQSAGEDRAIVAAASKIPLDRKPAVRPRLSRQQKESLAYWRGTPEIKQLFLWRGNQMSKLRLFAAAHPSNDPDGDPVPVTDEKSGIDPELAKVAAETVRRFRSQIGGQSEILRRLEQNLEATGELWVVGFADRPSMLAQDGSEGEPPEAEDWLVCSVSEIKYKGPNNGTTVGKWSVHRRPGDKDGRQLDHDKGDDLFRIWTPDLEWGEEPDCAMFGALAQLQLLQVLNDQIMAEARSRVPAGLFTWPNDLTLSRVNPQTPQDGDPAPTDKAIDVLVSAWTEAVYDPSDPATLAPLLVKGPKEALGPDVLRKIDLSRQTDGSVDTRIEGILERVFRGLDAPIETIKGHASTTFSNAEQIDQDTWEDYLEPRAVLVVDAVTVGYFRQQTLKNARIAGISDERLAQIDRMFVWYDESDLVSQPDPAEGADKGLELGAISGKSWRKYRGYSEDDAPDPIELILRMALQRGPLTPNVVVALLRILDPGVSLPEPIVARETTTTVQDSTDESMSASVYGALLHQLFDRYPQVIEEWQQRAGGERQALSARATLVTPEALKNGRDLVAIDRELRERLIVAADQAMTRALERAGNKAHGQARGELRTRLQLQHPLERVAHLGRGGLAELGTTPGELLDGSFDGLETQFMQWAEGAGDDAIEVVNRVVGGFTQAQRDALGLRLAESATEAWGWMKGTLMSLAEARLFDPHPDALTIGEFDPSLGIPPGMVRQAVARAGGSAGLITQSIEGGHSAWVALTDGGTAPAGGLATGEIMRGALRDNGAAIEGWEWEIGRPRVPFPPHRRLNGVQFTSFDDAVLANYSGWPPFGHYMPGDHDGCRCDVIPIMMQRGFGPGSPAASEPLAGGKSDERQLSRAYGWGDSANTSDRALVASIGNKLGGDSEFLAPFEGWEPLHERFVAQGRNWRRGQFDLADDPVDSECHTQTIELVRSDPSRYQHVFGYARGVDNEDVDVWVDHSWVSDTQTGRAIEMTPYVRHEYIGVELNDNERKAVGSMLGYRL